MLINTGTARGRIIAAALQLAGERPWSETSLGEIAGKAGVGLVELRREFSSKGAILAAFTRLVDDEVLAKSAGVKPAEGLRDTLFEVIMTRFDILQPYKGALKSISVSGLADAEVAQAILSSQAWMLRAAGVEPAGIKGGIEVAGLACIYGSVARTWLEDDDPGLARTMAVLDRRLRSGERTMVQINDACAFTGRIISAFAPRRPAQAKADGAAGPASGQPSPSG